MLRTVNPTKKHPSYIWTRLRSSFATMWNSWTTLCTSASLKAMAYSTCIHAGTSDSMGCRLPIDGHPQHSLRDREGHISTCEESSLHHFSACREGPLHQLYACGENLCGSDPRKVHFSTISTHGENPCASSPRKVHFSAISTRGEIPCGSSPKKVHFSASTQKFPETAISCTFP